MPYTIWHNTHKSIGPIKCDECKNDTYVAIHDVTNLLLQRLWFVAICDKCFKPSVFKFDSWNYIKK